MNEWPKNSRPFVPGSGSKPTRFGLATRAAGAFTAVLGAVGALVFGLRRRLALERTAALASALVLLPTYVHGFANWEPSTSRPPNPLSPGLLAAVREHVPTRAVVYADPNTSYRLGAYAPIRVCVAPVSHVADTVQNRPRERVREFLRSARAGDLVTPARACGATWLVVDRDRWSDLVPDLPVTYADARWVLYRLA